MFDYAAHGLIESAVKRDLPGAGPQTIGAVLDRQLALDPDKDALVGRSGRLSYAQLDEQVNRAVAVLRGLGICRYERIAACLPNDVDIVIAMLACARLGAIWVGVNRPLAAPEKAYILQDCSATLYLTDTPGCKEIEPLRESLPALLHLVSTDRDSRRSAWHDLLCNVAPAASAAVAVDPFEPAAIAYTSGTTGRPKGAVHSHHNILLPGAIEAHEKRYGPDCPQGVMLPLTILNLMVLAPMVAFQDGSCCVCMDSLKPTDVARWVREERVGHFACVPTVIQDLLTSSEVDPGDLATLGHPDIGGAGTAESVQTLYRQRFGRHMAVAYGMTEAPTIVTRTDADQEPREDLCGRAVQQVQVLVVDDEDQPVAAKEIGEICVRPANVGPYAGIYTTMLGYWNRPAASAEALVGGMYHTGDIGYLDAAGQLYIRGRRNELIIRGGANVYPAEVERVIASHPAVLAVAVLGVPDTRLGQRVAAVLELTEEANAPDVEDQLAETLRSFCGERLAAYKVPEQIRFVARLPRNAMNKIVKPNLLSLF